eukprot:NODE_140_length_16098_cov_0.678605.p12 type:complete len:174 gc:universal NODE_140_length_16098_cov_0.678605:12212-12733(+)
MNLFLKFYERGDIPIILKPRNEIEWKKEVGQLDLQLLLPLFCEGLEIKKSPLCGVVEKGLYFLIQNGENISEVIPSLIVPLRRALNNKDPKVFLKTFCILRKLVKAPGCGTAIVPFLRQFLPCLSRYYNSNYRSQVETTLNCFVENGGIEAFQNIKYIIPTFEYIPIYGEESD